MLLLNDPKIIGLKIEKKNPFKNKLLIYLWLHWVFVTAARPPLAVVWASGRGARALEHRPQ